VRGRTENALLRLPFRSVYIFRPGMIQPVGVKSKTTAYRWFYTLTKPLLPLLRAMLLDQILSTPQLGQAMLAAVRHGAPKRVLESPDINALSKRGGEVSDSALDQRPAGRGECRVGRRLVCVAVRFGSER
jgi:hypothetical protein